MMFHRTFTLARIVLRAVFQRDLCFDCSYSGICGCGCEALCKVERRRPRGKILETSTHRCAQARTGTHSYLLFLFNFINVKYPGSELAPNSHFSFPRGLRIDENVSELAGIGYELAVELAYISYLRLRL